MTHKRTYQCWVDMKKRCDKPDATYFENYGGRGIGYCARWKFYANFLEDMGEIPDGMTLERERVNEDYSKENCRWATMAEQNLNKRDYKNNTSGRRGVYKQSGYYRAIGTKNHKSTQLYWGPSYEEAVKARETWEKLVGMRVNQ